MDEATEGDGAGCSAHKGATLKTAQPRRIRGDADNLEREANRAGLIARGSRVDDVTRLPVVTDPGRDGLEFGNLKLRRRVIEREKIHRRTDGCGLRHSDFSQG